MRSASKREIGAANILILISPFLGEGAGVGIGGCWFVFFFFVFFWGGRGGGGGGGVVLFFFLGVKERQNERLGKKRKENKKKEKTKNKQKQKTNKNKNNTSKHSKVAQTYQKQELENQKHR